MLKLYQDNKINDKNYIYLLPLKQYLSNPANASITSNNEALGNFFVQAVKP
jgi:hypothetical protein